MFKSRRKAFSARTALAALVVAAGVGYVGDNVDAATTGNITLMGTVGTALDIEVTPAGSYNSLGLGSSQTDVLVATVRERANVSYDVSVQSTNYASCGAATSCLLSGANIVPLTLKIDGTTVTFTSATITYKTAAAASLNWTTAENVTVSYTIGSQLPAGTYTETYTFTISAT